MQILGFLSLVNTYVDNARQAIKRRRGDEGLSTLEIAVIALGLLAAATAVVVAITNAVNNRLEGIE
ncbi:hypothetical protein [Allosalinactinospora lopnorensis]|uniref:hypothetical protein n=1 Tax=Allosalinactinospora lopnorensis TaxID=1352348 RepID=UPI000623C47E|nr:hypothetical protein [Allosalinactinospora lopnorensis]